MADNGDPRVAEFVRQMRDEGLIVVAVYCEATGPVRLACPELSAETMADLLDTARDSYMARARSKLN